MLLFMKMILFEELNSMQLYLNKYPLRTFHHLVSLNIVDIAHRIHGTIVYLPIHE